jgi:hypothetical protein
VDPTREYYKNSVFFFYSSYSFMYYQAVKTLIMTTDVSSLVSCGNNFFLYFSHSHSRSRGNGFSRREFENGNTGMGTVGKTDVPEKSFYFVPGENSGTSVLKSHEVLRGHLKSTEVSWSFSKPIENVKSLWLKSLEVFWKLKVHCFPLDLIFICIKIFLYFWINEYQLHGLTDVPSIMILFLI